MIRALQTIGWSLLPPTPLELDGDVICLVGQNGSGKSSALDALKAVLGARRFGCDRSISAYRFAGRAGAPAVHSAYVLCVIGNTDLNGKPRLRGYGEELTLILEVGPKQRRFLVLDGRQLLPADARLAAALAGLREQHPRSAWLRPEEYERRILEPLGIGPAFRRLLELPQGEVQRVLDRDPRELVHLLLELSGGRAAGERFIAAQAAVAAARSSHAEAARQLDRRRADLAEMRLAAEDALRVQELRGKLAQLAGATAALLESVPKQKPRRTGTQASRPPLALNRAALQRAGITLVLEDGIWCVPPEEVETAAGLLGPGEALPVAQEGLAFLRARGALVCGPAAKTTQKETAPPAEEHPVTPFLRELERAQTALSLAGIEPLEPQEQWEPAGLLGALRALCPNGIPTLPAAEPLEQLERAEALLVTDRGGLERRREGLAEAEGSLAQARAVYEQAVLRTLESAGERFAELCQEAGLVGRFQVGESGGEAQVQIYAAEAEGEELRPLHGAQASLSGGWRAAVIVLAVLACLESEHSVSVLPLDEVGSSLDEPRLLALGQTFARLGRSRGLQTILTLPTRAQSEVIAEFSSQQVGFFRVLPDEPVAPPPHIVAAPLREVA